MVEIDIKDLVAVVYNLCERVANLEDFQQRSIEPKTNDTQLTQPCHAPESPFSYLESGCPEAEDK